MDNLPPARGVTMFNCTEVVLKSVNSTHARLHRVDRKAWLCKSNAAGGDAARECVRSANRLRTTRHNVPRSSSLAARVDPPPRRPGGWGLAGARKGDARGERSVWVVPLHRLAPSYQFSHRDYGRPSQNFKNLSGSSFLTEPPTLPIASDPRCDAIPRTSLTPKSGQK